MSDTAEKRPQILCVDDEPRILDGLKLTLRREFDVLVESGGHAALTLLDRSPEVVAVISDMRMPLMDGATFLSKVRERKPDVVRVLLTGDTGRDAAIAAVNNGQIFRFLAKPCTPDQLVTTMQAAARQHQLITSEKVLLQQTLLGSIHALIDILGIVNPVAFGRAGRLKRLANELHEALGHAPSWEIEAAALLSQIGYVSLPIELVEKIYDGARLGPDESKLANQVPTIAPRVLSKIPRLEQVVAILELAAHPASAGRSHSPEVIEQAAVLSAVLDFDAMTTRGENAAEAMSSLRGRALRHPPKVLDALSALVTSGEATPQTRELLLKDVSVGMILLDDVRTETGRLLVSRGYEVSRSFLERIRNFGPAVLNGTIRAAMPRAEPAAGHQGSAA